MATQSRTIPLLLEADVHAPETAPAKATCPPAWEVSTKVRDQFRALHASLTPKQSSARCVGVAGLAPGAGASWIVAKLACAAAEAGLSVSVADLSETRHTQLHLLTTGRDAGKPEPTPSDEAQQYPTVWPGLHVFEPAAESKQGDRQQFLTGLRGKSSLVLVDCPPLSDPSRLLRLGPALDGAIVVVESGRGLRKKVSEAAAVLQAAKIPVLSFVLNKQKRYLPAFLDRWL